MTEQAAPIKIRSTFLADEDCILIRCDMSQIEDRMCKMYCGTTRMVELANRHPANYDAHTENASLIFKTDINKLSKEDKKQKRYLGKKCVHGAERRMGGVRMSESISKDTDGELFIHPQQCEKLLRAFYEATPEIEGIYFPWVERQVRDCRMLVTSWGRRLDLRCRRIDNDLYKEAYSFYLQAEAADWTNQYLFIPAFHYMKARYGKAPNAQVHDEVIISVPALESYDAALVLMSAAQQVREIPRGSGQFLCVPAELSIGRNWGDGKAVEFKKLPHRDDFYQALHKGGLLNGTN